MIIETVPGIAWYDNFGDCPLGANIPEGWTKYGPGATPVCTAQPVPGPTVQPDSPSLGGRFLRFSSGGAVGLGMDVAGSPTTFEILMRLRSVADIPIQAESAGGGTVEHVMANRYGGPGGRMSVVGGQLLGIQLTGGCNRSRTFCNWFCTNLSKDNPFYEPPQSVNYYQHFMLNSKGSVAADSQSGWALYGDLRPYHMKSGRTYLQMPLIPGTAIVDIPAWFPPGINQVEPGKVTFWNWMRMRVEGSHIRGKWWSHGKDEPTRWEHDTPDVLNMHWPQNPGPVGILASFAERDPFFGDPQMDVDYVSISLDPENTPAPEAVIPASTNCPEPGRVGDAYSFQLLVEGVNN